MPVFPDSALSIIDGGNAARGNASATGAIVLIGPSQSGTANTIYRYGSASPAQVKADLGSFGPLAICAANIMATEGHAQVIAIPGTKTYVAVSAVTASIPGGSVGAVTLTGAQPEDFAEGIVKVHTAGAVGTSKFQYSLDNGEHWSAPIPTAATYLIAGYAVTLNFSAGNYAVGDTWSWTSYAPEISDANVSAAISALLVSTVDFKAILVLNGGDAAAIASETDAQRASDLATQVGALSTVVGSMWTARMSAPVLYEMPPPVAYTSAGLATYRSAYATALASIADYRIAVVGGPGRYSSAINPWAPRRPSCMFDVAIKLSRQNQLNLEPQDRCLAGDIGFVGDNFEGAIRYLYGDLIHDEKTTPAFNDARIISTCYRGGKIPCISDGITLATAGSDYMYLSDVMMLARGYRVAFMILDTYISRKIPLNGALAEAPLVVGSVEAKYAAGENEKNTLTMASNFGGCIQDCAVSFDESIVTAITKSVTINFSLSPLGSVKTSNGRIGFSLSTNVG